MALVSSCPVCACTQSMQVDRPLAIRKGNIVGLSKDKGRLCHLRERNNSAHMASASRYVDCQPQPRDRNALETDKTIVDDSQGES